MSTHKFVPVCGRPLKSRKGAVCTKGIPFGQPACRSHMLPEEHEAVAARERAHWEELEAEEPACWDWPVPVMPAFADDDQAERFLLDWHEFRCAICGYLAFPSIVDHDHVTGEVRGKLCRSCNVKEGVGVRPVILKYRGRNPATILGIHAAYWSPWTGYAEPVVPLTPDQEIQEQQNTRDLIDRLPVVVPQGETPSME